MIDREEKMKSNEETYEGYLAIVKHHGLESLTKTVERQDCENDVDESDLLKVTEEYNNFKLFAFETLHYGYL